MTMLRVAPLLVTVICCIAFLPNSQATSNGDSQCNAADTRSLYNHVKASAIDLASLEPYKIKKNFDMGQQWPKTIPVATSLLPLTVRFQAEGKLHLSWYNKWVDDPEKEPELDVYNDDFRAPLRIHAMDQMPGGNQGKASIYVLDRDQGRYLTNWIDAVFSCKKVYLDRFLFMDATCVNTPWGPRDYRVIIGTSHGESYLAVVYSNRGRFGGQHFVVHDYQGKLAWEHTEPSIHLMKITNGIMTFGLNMDYLPLKNSDRCHPLKPTMLTFETTPAPVHHRRSTTPIQNNAHPTNPPARHRTTSPPLSTPSVQKNADSQCNAANTQSLYNHVKAPAINFGSLDPYKVKKHFDMGKQWPTTISLATSMLPLTVRFQAEGNLYLSWYNKWVDDPDKEPELDVYNDEFRAPLRIHAMDQTPGGYGKASIYVLERDQGRDLTNWIDAVFTCKKVYLDRFLFMDATCVNTPWGPRDYRLIIGTTHGESYLAVVYSNRGRFGGQHFVLHDYQGKMSWEHTEPSIHLMKITDGIMTFGLNMDYLPLKNSDRCHRLKPTMLTFETTPAPVHHRRTTTPIQNNAHPTNAPSNNVDSSVTSEIRKLKADYIKMQNELRVFYERLLNLERRTGRK